MNQREQFQDWKDTHRRSWKDPSGNVFQLTDPSLFECWQAAHKAGQIAALEKAAEWFDAQHRGMIFPVDELRRMSQEIKDKKPS